MKIKNLTSRNVGIMAQHLPERGMPFRVNAIAGAVLELSDDDYAKVKPQLDKLVKLKVLEVIETAKSKLTAKEIVAKVSEEAGVDLKESMSKPELQKKAEALGVSV